MISLMNGILKINKYINNHKYLVLFLQLYYKRIFSVNLVM